MTPQGDMQRGFALRLYLGASYLFAPLSKRILRKRLARGKEHPTRWAEKQARLLAPRPKGPLIWLHAVGLGEVLSLRGLIARMATQRPDVSFLVTSTTRASAEVFGRNLPPRTIHQFLPIDAPRYRQRFLDHFRPDLCIWAEQDLWPGFVSDAARRGVPQAVVAARMNDASFQGHRKARGLYRDLYQAMALVTAQDQITADHLTQLGATVAVTGSLKPAAPTLNHDEAAFETLRKHCAHRFVWAVAPSHPADEAIATQAHHVLRETHPDALLIIAPRFPDRRDTFAQDIARKSKSELPAPHDPFWLCDTFGDLGLIYRLAQAVLIGGTNDTTQGHNPWEAAALQTAVFHGPFTENFRSDFATLDDQGGAVQVTSAAELAHLLSTDDLNARAARASACIDSASAQTDRLATDLLGLLKAMHD